MSTIELIVRYKSFQKNLVHEGKKESFYLKKTLRHGLLNRMSLATVPFKLRTLFKGA